MFKLLRDMFIIIHVSEGLTNSKRRLQRLKHSDLKFPKFKGRDILRQGVTLLEYTDFI